MFRLILLSCSRIVCLGYCVLAALTFVEVRKLLETDYVVKGDTYIIALSICEPGSSLSMDGNSTSVSYDVNDIDGCRTMEWIVNASAMSLILSAVAVLVFMVVDLLSRFGAGPFNRSSVGGMGLFLLFIMFQAIVSTWALAEECRYWSNYTEDYLKSLGLDGDIKTVTTHANKNMLWTAGLVGVITCALIVVEALMNICCGAGAKKDSDFNEHELGLESSKNFEDEVSSEQNSSPTGGSTSTPTSSGTGPSWATPTV